ncbi:hypothetical protein DL96DRAFT_1805602 [Flagelloscypha sp. PMI_526]|nr:hypothetical protein DL96DRAFT_1805602 [Flagelloscypha sp. PMI_526]
MDHLPPEILLHVGYFVQLHDNGRSIRSLSSASRQYRELFLCHVWTTLDIRTKQEDALSSLLAKLFLTHPRPCIRNLYLYALVDRGSRGSHKPVSHVSNSLLAFCSSTLTSLVLLGVDQWADSSVLSWITMCGPFPNLAHMVIDAKRETPTFPQPIFPRLAFLKLCVQECSRSWARVVLKDCSHVELIVFSLSGVLWSNSRIRDYLDVLGSRLGSYGVAPKRPPHLVFLGGVPESVETSRKYAEEDLIKLHWVKRITVLGWEDRFRYTFAFKDREFWLQSLDGLRV